MSALHQLQQNFQNYLLDKENDIKKHIIDQGTATAAQRLAVYFDAYRLRLIEILQTDFPKLHTLVGDEFFWELCTRYIETHPSMHFNARYFGRYLCQFLATDSHYCDEQALIEMATFEWAMGETLDAADADILVMDHMAELDTDDWPWVRFILHPSFRCFSFEWNVPRIWQAIENEEPPRLPEKVSAPITWMLWRHDLNSYFSSCTPEDAFLIRAIQAGDPFAKLCEGLCTFMDETSVPPYVIGLLRYWTEQKLFAGFHVVKPVFEES
jgi:hypothetical protein